MTQQPWGPGPHQQGMPPLPQYGRPQQAPSYPTPAPPTGGYAPGWDPTQPLGHPRPGSPTGQPLPGQRPLGQQPPPRVTIDQFRQPGTGLPRWVTVLAVLAVLGLIGWGASSLLAAPPAPPTTQASTRAASPGSTETRVATGTSSRWVADDRGAEGWWEIQEERWSGDSVTLKILLECSKGETPVEFFVISNANVSNTWEAQPTSSGRQPNLNRTRVRAGDRIVGYVTVAMPRQPATLIMGSSSRNAISGLEISG